MARFHGRKDSCNDDLGRGPERWHIRRDGSEPGRFRARPVLGPGPGPIFLRPARTACPGAPPLAGRRRRTVGYAQGASSIRTDSRNLNRMAVSESPPHSESHGARGDQNLHGFQRASAETTPAPCWFRGARMGSGAGARGRAPGPASRPVSCVCVCARAHHSRRCAPRPPSWWRCLCGEMLGGGCGRSILLAADAERALGISVRSHGTWVRRTRHLHSAELEMLCSRCVSCQLQCFFFSARKRRNRL